MRLIVFPYGGLANRMRAIDSAINMQNDGLCKVKILWYKDQQCGCAFTDIFSPVKEVKDLKTTKVYRLVMRILLSKNCMIRSVLYILQRMRFFRWYPKEDIDGPYNFACLKEGRYLVVLMETWEYFYEKDKFNSDYIKIKDNATYNSCCAHIDGNTIGVHIRRGDHKLSIQNSPLDLFESAMMAEHKKNINTNYLLCTDDDGIKDYFSNSVLWRNIVYIPAGVISRDSTEGIKQAAGEMYALSKTRKIIGSYWSSFSLMAAKLGGIDVNVMCKDDSNV